MFLVDNAVSLESDNLVTEMGEANNANTVNFSTNIGVGFNYEISQKLQLVMTSIDRTVTNLSAFWDTTASSEMEKSLKEVIVIKSGQNLSIAVQHAGFFHATPGASSSY